MGSRFPRYLSRLVGIASCFGLLAWISPAGYAQTLKQTLDKHLSKLGARLAEEQLYETHSKTPLERARYAYIEYCRTLKACRAGVNASYASRLSNRWKNGDQNLLTCGWHNDNLKLLFAKSGIDPKDIVGIVADDKAFIKTINSEHGALAIKNSDGKVYFFDPWQMAVKDGSSSGDKSLYDSAETSRWNGMEATAWETEMKAQGYVQFSDSLQQIYLPDVGSTLLRLGINAPTGLWSGRWKSREGKQTLILKQFGRTVTGVYTDASYDPPNTGSCKGEIDPKHPDKFVGTFIHNAFTLQGREYPAYTRTVRWTLKDKNRYFDSEDGNVGIWYMWRK
jgi:hypothetical protein